MVNNARSMAPEVGMVVGTMMSAQRPVEVSTGNNVSIVVALFIRAGGTRLVPA